MECDNCKQEWDNKKHIPRILSCGHSICEECLSKIIEQSKVISHKIINYNIHDVDFYDTRNKSDYVNRHAVNVAIVSCIIAKSMGYSEKELEEITLAGLLHDFARSNQSDSNIVKKRKYYLI